MIAIIAIGLKFLSFQLLYSSQYETIILASIAAIETVNTSLRVLFFAIIGSVILSWVAPNNNNPLLKIIEEISSKTLSPIRKLIPSFGGLDVTPIFAFILIRQVEVFLATIIRSIL
jgi:YggT family protein